MRLSSEILLFLPFAFLNCSELQEETNSQQSALEKCGPSEESNTLTTSVCELREIATSLHLPSRRMELLEEVIATARLEKPDSKLSFEKQTDQQGRINLSRKIVESTLEQSRSYDIKSPEFSEDWIDAPLGVWAYTRGFELGRLPEKRHSEMLGLISSKQSSTELLTWFDLHKDFLGEGELVKLKKILNFHGTLRRTAAQVALTTSIEAGDSEYTQHTAKNIVSTLSGSFDTFVADQIPELTHQSDVALYGPTVGFHFFATGLEQAFRYDFVVDGHVIRLLMPTRSASRVGINLPSLIELQNALSRVPKSVIVKLENIVFEDGYGGYLPNGALAFSTPRTVSFPPIDAYAWSIGRLDIVLLHELGHLHAFSILGKNPHFLKQFHEAQEMDGIMVSGVANYSVDAETVADAFSLLWSLDAGWVTTQDAEVLFPNQLKVLRSSLDDLAKHPTYLAQEWLGVARNN